MSRYFLSVCSTGLNWNNNFSFVRCLGFDVFSQIVFLYVLDCVAGPSASLQDDYRVTLTPLLWPWVGRASSLTLDCGCGCVICFDQGDVSVHNVKKGLGPACVAGLPLALCHC